MDIRALDVYDIPAAVEFAIAGLRPAEHPGVRVSREKVTAMAMALAGGRRDTWHRAAFDQGRMVGGIAVLVSESPWFERCDAHVVMFRTTVPGLGAELLRQLRDWIDETFRVRRVLWPLEHDAPAALARYARMHGFDRASQLMVFHKR